MEIAATNLIERIKEKCEIKDLESIGISAQVVSNWKSRNSIPKADDLYKIAQYLGCSMEYLLTGNAIDDDYIFLSAREQNLLNNYKKLDNEQKKNIEYIIEALAGK